MKGIKKLIQNIYTFLFGLQLCCICNTALKAASVICCECLDQSVRLAVKKHDTTHPGMRIISLMNYTGISRDIFQMIKFEKLLSLTQSYVELLDTQLRVQHYNKKETLIVPAPSSSSQSNIIGIVCKALSSVYSWRTANCLKKTSRRAQKLLSRKERRRFSLDHLRCTVKAFSPDITSILLVDDIITTGATMGTCIKALRQKTAIPVSGIALFRDN